MGGKFMFSSMPAHIVELPDGTSFIIDPKNFEPTAHRKLSVFSPKIEPAPAALPPPLPLTRSIGYDNLACIRRGSDSLDKIAEKFHENISVELRELVSFLPDFEKPNKPPRKFMYSAKEQAASDRKAKTEFKFNRDEFKEEPTVILPFDVLSRLRTATFLLDNSILFLPLINIVLDYLKEEEELLDPPKLTHERSFTM